MQFFTTDADGLTLVDPGEAQRRRILETVEEDADADYPEVYLTFADGLVLGYRQGGYLSWEESGELVRVAGPVNLQTAIKAWNYAVCGDLASLRALPWREAD